MARAWFAGLALGFAALAQAAPPLPQIESVTVPDCIQPGSEIAIAGQNFGTGADGWALEIAGVTLETSAWTDRAIRAKVPEVIRDGVDTDELVVILRSRSGALLARGAQRIRICESVRRDGEATNAQEGPARPDAEGAEPPAEGPSTKPTRGLGPRARRAPPGAAAPSTAADAFLEGEILIGVPDRETADHVEASARALGIQEPARLSELDGLGFMIVHVRFADREAAEAAASRLRELHPKLRIEPNHPYRRDGMEQMPDPPPVFRNSIQPQRQSRDLERGSEARREEVGWPRRPHCGRGLRVGMIDTAVRRDHPDLVRASVTKQIFVPGSTDPDVSDPHGTSIASLLVGHSLGLLPEAKLYAASVFWSEDGQLRSSAEQIIRAVAWLLAQDVEVINLSLTGPPSELVADALRRAHDRGVELVGAAGNDGPDRRVAFPASLDEVVAVTAVDSLMRIYPSAARGSVDLAAPGVDVVVAGMRSDQDELAMVSGTSYAVPFVAAALALETRGLPALIDTARDLGDRGRDSTFGWGLLQTEGLCREDPSTTPIAR